LIDKPVRKWQLGIARRWEGNINIVNMDLDFGQWYVEVGCIADASGILTTSNFKTKWLLACPCNT
jgi:hypothetical protein